MCPVSSGKVKGLSNILQDAELEKSAAEENCLQRAEGGQREETKFLISSGVSKLEEIRKADKPRCLDLNLLIIFHSC